MDQETILLFEVAMIMISAGVAAIIFAKLRVPVMIGYLFAGILLGPHVFPQFFVFNTDIINLLANLGIILLMFSIGLDFNIKRLRKVGMFAILAGTIEVVMMILIGYEIGLLMGWNYIQSVFLGAVLSISSTAVIVKVLIETGSMKKPFADAIIGLLIIEDLAAVMILTFISPLAAGQTPGMNTFVSELFGILGFITLSIILGLAVVPKVINWVGKGFNDEVLLLVSLGFCFVASIFAFFLGLSVAIGAFILGVVISESRENERIANKIDSIKIMFMAIFFVSIGLLIDPWIVLENLPLVLIIAAIFIFGKILAVTLACFVSNQTMRTSVTAGFAMVAMGEFSFVIAKVGLDTGAVSSTFYSCVIGAALITMVVMPSAFGRSTKSLDWAVEHIPRALYVPIRRIESMRSEMSRSFAKHSEYRGKITRQAFWILIDFTILFLIQVFVGTIYDISKDLKPIANWLGLIPSTLAAIISVALLIPPMADVIVRIRRIGFIIVQSVLEGGNYHWDSGRMILKQFVNFFFIIIGVIFFLAILPFNAYYDEFPLAPLVGLVIGSLIAYLLWDINKATYTKMRAVLTTGLIDPKEEQR